MVFVVGELLSARPFIGLRLGYLSRDAVALLNPSDQLFFLAGDGRPVIVGQLTPALARRSGKLFPFALDLIPVHESSGSVRARVAPNGKTRELEIELEILARDLQLAHQGV